MTYIPKVGKDCLYSLGDSGTWHKCNIIFIVGTQGVVMESKQVFEGVQYCSLFGKEAVKFKPAKTPSEIEREKGVDEIVEIIVNFYGNPKGAESYKLLAEKLYVDEIYRKQQVKPLSRSYATLALQITNMAYDDLAGLGFIVQGGE